MTGQTNPAHWRDVPEETLRDFYQGLNERHSLRDVEALCGVGHSTLSQFLKGAKPIPRIRRLLALHYMEAHGAHDPNATAALDILAGFFPEPQRQGFKLEMARGMAAHLAAIGEPLPAWLAAMLEAPDAVR